LSCNSTPSRTERGHACRPELTSVGASTVSPTVVQQWPAASNYYRTNVRGAGVAWCAGFGRLGGVGGPLLGGFLIGGGFAFNSSFYVLAGLDFLGLL
jgi:AAHS family benzoate transporter-like MFS transporter